jgi:hypothetical protein
MRNSYRLKVRAVHQDPSGAARILLSGTDSSIGSSWAALLIVDTHVFETSTVPVPGEEYVISLSPDPKRESTKVRC